MILTYTDEDFGVVRTRRWFASTNELGEFYESNFDNAPKGLLLSVEINNTVTPRVLVTC